MHRMADEVAASVAIPLLHIADPTAGRIKAAGYQRVGLLGTAFTMEQDFYKGRLTEKFGLDVLVPDEADRAVVHNVIYKELVLGEVKAESRAASTILIVSAGQSPSCCRRSISPKSTENIRLRAECAPPNLRRTSRLTIA